MGVNYYSLWCPSCVLFVIKSTNIQLFQRRDMYWQLMVFTGRTLGQYADQELLKSLSQNKTPDLIKLEIYDQQGQQWE